MSAWLEGLSRTQYGLVLVGVVVGCGLVGFGLSLVFVR